jgi:hypothetical protein
MDPVATPLLEQPQIVLAPRLLPEAAGDAGD